MDALADFKKKLHDFASERDWQQFHSPKNLSMALVAEAGELVEHFQWLSQEQSLNLSPETLAEVELEMADIFIYLVRLADRLDVDLLKATEKKIRINAEKYPVGKVRGSAKKYDQYGE